MLFVEEAIDRVVRARNVRTGRNKNEGLTGGTRASQQRRYINIPQGGTGPLITSQ